VTKIYVYEMPFPQVLSCCCEIGHTNCVKKDDCEWVSVCYVADFSFAVDHKYFPFSALTLFVGRQEGHLACKNFEPKPVKPMSQLRFDYDTTTIR